MHGPRLPRRIADSVKRCFCLDGDSRLPDPWRVAARGEPGPAARPTPALLSPPGSRHPSAALTTAGHSLGRRTRAWQEAPAFLPGPRHRQALQQRCPDPQQNPPRERPPCPALQRTQLQPGSRHHCARWPGRRARPQGRAVARGVRRLHRSWAAVTSALSPAAPQSPFA